MNPGEEYIDSFALKLVNYDRNCINLFDGDWIDQFSILLDFRGYEQVFANSLFGSVTLKSYFEP